MQLNLAKRAAPSWFLISIHSLKALVKDLYFTQKLDIVEAALLPEKFCSKDLENYLENKKSHIWCNEWNIIYFVFGALIYSIKCVSSTLSEFIPSIRNLSIFLIKQKQPNFLMLAGNIHEAKNQQLIKTIQKSSIINIYN